MSNPTQASPFCGREADLAHLQDVWHKVEQGEPQVVVLLAESGLGKTRLVQEFYNWLSVEKDGVGDKGYWPDVLVQKSGNLAVNPDISGCNDANVMPYLWWALRLKNPEGRNEILSKTVHTHLEYLRPHLESMYWSRRKKEFWLESGKTVGEMFIGAIPVIGNITSFALPFFDLLQQSKDTLEDKRPSLSEREQQKPKEQNLRIIDDLRKVLAIQKSTANIPAVIVFDDAQFSTADENLVDLVDKLLSTALTENWPVMFLFTHWEQEWLKHVAEAKPSVAKRIHVICQKDFENWQPYRLEAIRNNGLAPVLKEHLTGLTNEQIEAILERVDGNPLFLDEIIRFSVRKDSYFKGDNVNNPLTNKGLTRLLEESITLHDLVEKRFDAIPKDVRHTLSVSSLQGMYLLPMLSEVLLKELEKRGEQLVNDSDASQTLKIADNPYRFLNYTGEGLAEFCQNIFYEVAHKGLRDIFEDTDKLEDAFFSILRKLADEDASSRLTDLERDVLLDLTAATLAKSDDETDRSYAQNALFKLIEKSLATYNYKNAEVIAQRVMEGVEKNLWTLTNVDFWQLYQLYNAFEKMWQFKQASLVAMQMLENSEMRTTQFDTANSQRDLLISYIKVAEIQQAKGEFDTAMGNYQKGLEISQTLAVQIDTTESQRDLSVLYNRVAEIQQVKGELEASLENYQKCLEISEMLATRLDTPDSQRSLSISYERVADIQQIEGKIDAAMGNYQRGLEISQTLVVKLNTPESQRDLLISYTKFGDIQKTKGELDIALENYQKGLEISQILTVRLNTPKSKEDVSVSYTKVADIQQTKGEIDTAMENHQKALEIRKILVAQLGTPDSQQRLSTSYERVANIQLAKSEFDAAMKNHQKALEIRKILAAQLDTPDLQQGLSTSYERIGDIQEAQGKFDTAMENHQKALEIREILVRQIDSPQSQLNLSVSYERIAGIQKIQGKLDAAMINYQKVLEIRKILVMQLDTPESQRNLSFSYQRVANIQQAQGELDSALGNYQKCLDISQTLATQLSTPGAQRDLLISYSNVADIQKAKGELNTALRNYQICLDISETLVAQLGTFEAQQDQSLSHEKIAHTHLAKGELDAAMENYQKVLRIRETLAAQLNTPHSQQSLSDVYTNIGDIQQAQGQLDAAMENYQQVLEISKMLVVQLDTLDIKQRLSVSYERVANIQEAKGELNAAMENYEKVLRIRETLAAQLNTTLSQRNLAVSYNKIADIQQAQGQFDAAMENYQKGYEISKLLVTQLNTPGAQRDLVISYFKLAYISENGKGYLLKALDHAESYQRMQPCPDSDFMVDDLIQRIEELA